LIQCACAQAGTPWQCISLVPKELPVKIERHSYHTVHGTPAGEAFNEQSGKRFPKKYIVACSRYDNLFLSNKKIYEDGQETDK
jgi:hypothetical protein